MIWPVTADDDNDDDGHHFNQPSLLTAYSI